MFAPLCSYYARPLLLYNWCTMYIPTIPPSSHTLLALPLPYKKKLFSICFAMHGECTFLSACVCVCARCACTVFVMNTRSFRSREHGRSVEQRNGLAWLARFNQQSYAGICATVNVSLMLLTVFILFLRSIFIAILLAWSRFILNCDGRCLLLRMRHINSSTLFKTIKWWDALQHTIYKCHETELAHAQSSPPSQPHSL